jgi:predicted RNA-binding Zn ribbon-like protein
MEPLFLAGHPALDFLNTRPTPRGSAEELLGDGRALARWLEQAGLLAGESAASLQRRLGAGALDAAAGEARKLREWARDWLSRRQDAPRHDYDAERRRLNRALEGARSHRELVSTAGGLRLDERPRVESAADLAGLLALQIAKLLADEAPELVKRCAGAGCNLWFVDRTKAHARVFCSAAVCGNRAKVAAYRERQRASARRR